MSDLELFPVSANIGAEVRGADLTDVDDALFEAIGAALLEHQVLFFRKTGIDDAQHMALAERFGPISVFPLNHVLGDDSPTFQVIEDGPDSRPTADEWHTDVTWIAEPPKVGLLRAAVVPERGGDTMWGSMTAAYDALSPPLARLMEGLTVIHDSTGFIEAVEDKMGREAADAIGVREKLTAAYPPVEHPLVRTHPETGRRSLFAAGYFMRRVKGLEAHESEALLRLVSAHIDQPRFHCRWRWEPEDLAIWDERCTVHRAVADHFPQRRQVRRCVVDGDRPYFERG